LNLKMRRIPSYVLWLAAAAVLTFGKLGAGELNHNEDGAVRENVIGGNEVDHSLDGLSDVDRDRELMRREHEEFMKVHAGHEGMHAEMMLVLFVVMMLSQVLLVIWRKHYFNSYQVVTLIGMYFIPVYFSVELHFYKMLVIWATFSVATAYVVFKATRKPLAQTTPRSVYTYFTVLYKLTYFATFGGYGLALLDFLGLGVLIQITFHPQTDPHPLMTIGLIMMFYGLYFGVLVRDFAEICAGSMASVIGYYNKDGAMPKLQLNDDVCAICGDSTKASGEDDPEKMCKLRCGHSFHEFCIRGWTIIGKKETCPYCGEKVDLKVLFPQPWSLERQDVLFSQLLDAIRYLVVWQPVIVTLVKGINQGLGLE